MPSTNKGDNLVNALHSSSVKEPWKKWMMKDYKIFNYLKVLGMVLPLDDALNYLEFIYGSHQI